MGFPSVCYCVILPQPLILVLQLLDFLRHAFLLCLSYLGLAPPAAADDHPPSPPPPPLSPPDLWPAASSAQPPPASIKARLPAVRYSDFAKNGRHRPHEPPPCAVCLGALEPRHKVRELGNCAHAFHKACIDKWVDKGQATCPLCRALLLPKNPPSSSSSSAAAAAAMAKNFCF